MTSMNKFENMALNYYDNEKELSKDDMQIVWDYRTLATSHYAYSDAKLATDRMLYIRNTAHMIYDETYDKIQHYDMLNKRVDDLNEYANTCKINYDRALRRVDQHGVDSDELTGMLHMAWYDYAYTMVGNEISTDDYQYDLYVLHTVQAHDPLVIACFAHAFYAQYHTMKRLQQSMDRLRKMQQSLEHVKGVNDTMLYVQLFTSAYNNLKAIHTGIMSDVSDCETFRKRLSDDCANARQRGDDNSAVLMVNVMIVLDQYISQWYRYSNAVSECMTQADALHRLVIMKLRKAQQILKDGE